MNPSLWRRCRASRPFDRIPTFLRQRSRRAVLPGLWLQGWFGLADQDHQQPEVRWLPGGADAALTPATMRCVFTGCPNIQLIRVKLSAAHPTAGMPVEVTAFHWSPVFGRKRRVLDVPSRRRND